MHNTRDIHSIEDQDVKNLNQAPMHYFTGKQITLRFIKPYFLDLTPVPE